MRERGVSKEEKAGLSELSRIIDSIYYTYGVKHSSISATYYVDLGTTERLIYRLRRVF